jgi:hypothetical protein
VNPLTCKLAKVSLIRLGCPAALQEQVSNIAAGVPILVAANQAKLGTTKTGYSPSLIVQQGEAMRKSLLAAGVIKSWVWATKSAQSLLTICADDEISCEELMDKLSSLLKTKFYGRQDPALGQPYPGILQIYPFENYLIYQMKGQKYRQRFNLDPIERKVALNGPSVAVEEKFIDACGATKQAMPRVQTGARYAFAPPMGNVQSMTQGARNSELIIHVIRSWANVEHAAAAYVNATKTGLAKPMQPSFFPVNISNDGKILASLRAAGIDPFEFALWSFAVQKKHQTSDGKRLLEKGA